MSKAYIGETGRKLITRITEDLRNIRQHTNTIIGLHFNTTCHTIEHVQSQYHKKSLYI